MTTEKIKPPNKVQSNVKAAPKAPDPLPSVREEPGRLVWQHDLNTLRTAAVVPAPRIVISYWPAPVCDTVLPASAQQIHY